MFTEELPRSPDFPPAGEPPSPWPRRVLFGGIGLIVLLLVGFVAAAFGLSGASLDNNSSALAAVNLQAFGGSVSQVTATGPNGNSIPVVVRHSRVLPRHRLTPGEPVTVTAVISRPGWIGWLAGGKHTETLRMRAPAAKVRARWLTVAKHGKPRIAFDRPVSAVAFGPAGELTHRRFDHPRGAFHLSSDAAAGSVVVMAAARPWERLGHPQSVTWFPASGSPAVAATPAAGSEVTPSTPLRLTFSKPVSKVLGSSMPTLSPAVPGHWHRVDPHTVAFHPTGFGAPFAVKLKAELPEAVDVVAADGSVASAKDVEWEVPAGSTLRLQQLLAQTGYMPVDWKPDGAAVAKTPAAEVDAAVDPPDGSFSWRYHHTPAPLREVWSAGQPNVVTQGALMAFEADHEMETDGVAGPQVWQALMQAAIAGDRKSEPGYSYVYVTKTLPETVHLWHNGHTVLSGAANTGISGAETEAGTFPVFEHIEETTMSGENPDGSHYEDPGIKWVSYFNGGDALHAFDRASFGTPQSLGCVEMPLEEAEAVYPYTPIGTLVTVEND